MWAPEGLSLEIEAPHMRRVLPSSPDYRRTTYTYLTTTYYNKVAAAVDRAVPYQRMVSPVDAFDLCYALDIDKTSVELPAIALHFSGGAKLEVIRPYVLIGDSQTISWSITASLLIV